VLSIAVLNKSLQGAIIDILGHCLSDELQYVNGRQFETDSLWADLLSISFLIDKISHAMLSDKKLTCFTEMSNFPNVSPGDIDAIHVSIHVVLCDLCYIHVCICWIGPDTRLPSQMPENTPQHTA